MQVNAKIVRAADGNRQVLLDLAEFQALLDAARMAEHGAPDVEELVRELDAALRSGEGSIELDDFLAEYDAVHGSD
jgi:hypothetical protein